MVLQTPKLIVRSLKGSSLPYDLMGSFKNTGAPMLSKCGNPSGLRRSEQDWQSSLFAEIPVSLECSQDLRTSSNASGLEIPTESCETTASLN